MFKQKLLDENFHFSCYTILTHSYKINCDHIREIASFHENGSLQ